MALSARREFRQHSKSTLLRASQALFAERAAIVAREGTKWRRRLIAAALLSFGLGLGLGRLLLGS
jgi:hypothetical protein